MRGRRVEQGKSPWKARVVQALGAARSLLWGSTAALAASACSPTVTQTPLPAPYKLPADTSRDWSQPPSTGAHAARLPSRPVQTFQLPTGLRVSVVEVPDSPTTALRLWVPEARSHRHGQVGAMLNALRAGSRVGDTVLSNPRLSGRPIASGLDASGATFRWEVLSRATRPALELLAAYTTRPAFEAEPTLARLRQSLSRLQQYSLGLEYLHDLNRAQVPGFHKPGNEEVAKAMLALSPEAMATIHRCRLVPRNSELVVVGGVKFEEVQRWAPQFFGEWQTEEGIDCSGWAEPEARAEPALKRPMLNLVASRTPEPRVALVLPAPPVGHPDHLPFRLIASALAVSQASIGSDLRHSGATYGIHASVNTGFEGQALLELSGGLKSDGVKANLRSLVAALGDFSSSVTDEDLETAKRMVVSATLALAADNGGIAGHIAHQTRRLGAPPKDINEEAKELLAIPAARARAAAQSWTDGVQPVLMVLADPKLQITHNLRLGATVNSWTFREAR